MFKWLVLILGILATLTGFRVINWSKKPSYEVFYSKWARAMLIAGPIMSLLGILWVFFTRS